MILSLTLKISFSKLNINKWERIFNIAFEYLDILNILFESPKIMLKKTIS